MSEKALWRSLQKYLPKEGHFTRIENECSSGFPDTHYTYKGVTGTIELKKSRNPKAKYPFKTGGLRKTQTDWIEDEIAANGIVWIIAQVGRKIFTLSGVHAERFNGLTLSELEMDAEMRLGETFGKKFFADLLDNP